MPEKEMADRRAHGRATAEASATGQPWRLTEVSATGQPWRLMEVQLEPEQQQ